MSEYHIRTIGLLITFAATLYSLKKRDDLPVFVFVIFGPLSYFSQNMGLVLSPAKLMSLMFLIHILMKPRKLSYLRNVHLRRFIRYYTYTVFLTLLMAIFWPDYNPVSQGFFYGNTMRGFVQIFQVVLGLAIVIVIISGLKFIYLLYRVQLTLLGSMTAIAFYGIYVWFAQNLGLPFNSITRQGGLTGGYSDHVISTVIGGVQKIRAYSFTGEPKALAVNACFGIVLSLFTPANKTRIRSGIKWKIVLIPLFLITLYLTYSTAGYLILPMILIAALTILTITDKLTHRLALNFGLVFLLGAGIMLVKQDSITTELTETFDHRIQFRLEDQGFFTYAEESMALFWSDNPLFCLTGVGLGGSSFYVREYDTLSYSGYLAAPRGIIGFIGDKGIIGLWLFFMALFKTAKIIYRAASSSSPHRQVYRGILIVCTVNFILMLTYSLWYVEWLTVGLACASATIAEKEFVNTPPPVSRIAAK